MKKSCIVFFALVCSVLLMACTSQGAAVSSPTPGVTGTGDPAPTATGHADDSVYIEEQVLYDENDISIKATALTVDESMGPMLALSIDNHSQKRIGLRPFDVSVNGYMVTPLINVTVNPGESTTANLAFDADEIDAYGIQTVGSVALQISIYDVDEYEELYTTDPVTIPTSAAETVAQVYDDAGDVVFDEKDVKITYQRAQESIIGPAYRFYIENNTDKRISVQARNATVNGEDISPKFNCIVMPGKAAVHAMAFKLADLSDNDIETITQITFKIVIYDTDGFDDIAVSDAIVIEL